VREFSAFFTARAASFMTARDPWKRNGSGTSRAVGDHMIHHPIPSIARLIGASVLLASLASSPRAQTPDSSQAAVGREVHGLKAGYLRCEQAANEHLLGIGDAARCSAIHERLLKVGFGGDFRLLLAWWHGERVAEKRGERIDTP
jgi:hypothetical protein